MSKIEKKILKSTFLSTSKWGAEIGYGLRSQLVVSKVLIFYGMELSCHS